MMFARLGVLMLAASLIAAAPLPYVYSAPAGDRPAGAPHPNRPYDVILPNGRIVAPTGDSMPVGRDAFSFALAPGARYAVVADGSLRVVDVKRMRTISDLGGGEGWGGGVAAFPEPGAHRRTLVLASNPQTNAVALLYLTPSGHLTMLHRFAVDDPGAIAMAPDDRTAYVVERAKDRLAAIDISGRTLGRTAHVGFTPEDVIATKFRAYVTNPGLLQVRSLPAPALQPSFAALGSAQQASSLTAIALRSDGSLSNEGTLWTPMDEPVDGVDRIGGAYPGAIALAKNRRFAYVCMQNVDRVAVLDVWDVPRVVAGLQLRLFDKSPYGTQPDALAVSPDGKRLYVALAGINAVAVLDARNPVHLHRLGLIPTGWYPSALAPSPDGRYLYILNARGDGATGTLQRVDLHHLPLAKTTLSALRYTRVPHPGAADAVVPPLRSLQRSSVVSHVVFVRAGTGNWQSLMGPATQTLTPNLHALAARFAVAQNFYAEGPTAATAEQIPSSGLASTAAQRYDEFGPSAYPRAGFLFNALARAGLTYRDYGGLMRLPGAGSEGFTTDAPALGVLAGHVDLRYPQPGAAVSDAARADAFAQDYEPLAAAGTAPAFAYVDLPASTPADLDAAVGTLVADLSHQPTWNSTAIFIAPDAQDGDVMAPSFVLVVSPYARRGAGSLHVSTASIVKTEEELLGLPSLSLGDLLAPDLSGFFEPVADGAPYDAQSAGRTNGEQSASP